MRIEWPTLRRQRCDRDEDHVPHIYWFRPFPRAIGMRRFCPGD